jgi:hypothetical protein
VDFSLFPVTRRGAGLSSSKFLSRAPQAAIHLLALICSSTATLIANPQEGGISGEVADPQNGVVAGALSKLVNAAGVAIFAQRSDAQGKIALAAHKERRKELR